PRSPSFPLFSDSTSSSKIPRSPLTRRHCRGIDISGAREHVQEVHRGQIRPFQGPAQAGTVRVLAIEPFSTADITNSSSLPLLRAASDLITSSTRTGMTDPRSQATPLMTTTTRGCLLLRDGR
uniref:Uncharacterized protein n=1 Tax=Triticum urartu TaxID=4572 RepID=A0A8R7TWN4_TRIUA